MLESVKYVKKVYVNPGKGKVDFIDILSELKPDFLIVNEDGHSVEKENLCNSFTFGPIKYVVLQRIPKDKLPSRSTTSLKSVNMMPFRIDLAGGWLDQPYVSSKLSSLTDGGPVLTISLDPSIQYEFNQRSGMASSTRNHAIEIWGNHIPSLYSSFASLETLAKILFCYDNPPGNSRENFISGSQDSIGILYPGLNYLKYTGQYWPSEIKSVYDEDILSWLEELIYLKPIKERPESFSVLEEVDITELKAQALADASNRCWNAILKKNIQQLAENFTGSFKAQVSMFPKMIDEKTQGEIDRFLEWKIRMEDAGNVATLGFKLSGSGGGGYLILVCDFDLRVVDQSCVKIKIRRRFE